jgi:hypothetical protein
MDKHLDPDATFARNKSAKDRGVLGRRFELIVPAAHDGLKQSTLFKMLQDAGIEFVSLSSGVCCLPCRGRGVVDDGTAVGCIRITMPCPECDGQGDFRVVVNVR